MAPVPVSCVASALVEAEVARGRRESEDRRGVMTPRPPTTMPAAMTYAKRDQ